MPRMRENSQEVGFELGRELRAIFGATKSLEDILVMKDGSPRDYLTGIMMGWSAAETNKVEPLLIGPWH